MRRILAGTGVAVLLVAGYGAFDVYDVVPGILTRDVPAPAPTVTPSAGATTPAVVLPTVDEAAVPLEAASAGAPIPAATSLAQVIGRAAKDPALGASPGVVVRDAFTGQNLFRQNADTARRPASTVKLLTALAVSTTLDPTATLPTTVVQGSSPSQLVLVAGGDSMLAKGAGNPAAVEGRAGLGDLAQQVATALAPSGTTNVTLRLDTTYAAGPRYAPTWVKADIDQGFTGGVSMLGLAGQRAVPYHPAPRNPEAATAAAFVAALAKVGITATLAPASTWDTRTPAGATELGRVESAPIGDVLALALAESDNALTDGLARQAAVKKGGGTSFAAAVSFVLKQAQANGIDTTGVVLKDTSGLSAGQKVPPRVISDALQRGADGSVPGMQDVVAQLPVAGLSGTLADRFNTKGTHVVAGNARAKTGTLTGISSIAGTVVDADGRVLSYVVLADGVPAGVGTLNARAALDRFVATLATCGCR
ncbi:D-alanyl-D-alanine carboxypeptidase/D-alanyl-D-alanine endopeptidase [Knoellia koreensis]|uniref:D-alanyl-D-alanine carboxypeptidase/D-alanyl-D-alanine-endopeptidase n=1 Tax=Knoellia koreensis TaxID=2730921 RepID=A0A849HMS3_9MICO|nr:D-alanyl-D-alanine carboxypeptidase/D-alanyl-D-alanine-endopeptidase [Knoellia sp. DB2414S]